MIITLFLFAAAFAQDAARPDLLAYSEYRECVQITAINLSTSSESADVLVRAAEYECRNLRNEFKQRYREQMLNEPQIAEEYRLTPAQVDQAIDVHAEELLTQLQSAVLRDVVVFRSQTREAR